MRVDVDPLALGLLEQFVEVFQVVAGDDDALAADRSDPHRRRFGMAVGAGVGGVEQAHHVQVQFADLHRPGEQRVAAGVWLGEEIERFVEGGVDGRVFMAEKPGVIGVGRRALQPVEDQFLEARHVVAQPHLLFRDRHLLALPYQAGQIGGRLPGGGPVQLGRRLACLGTSRFVDLSRLVANGDRVGQVAAEPFGVEIDVGDRGEQEGQDRTIHLTIGGPQFGRSMGVHRNALRRVDQQVLQGRGRPRPCRRRPRSCRRFPCWFARIDSSTFRWSPSGESGSGIALGIAYCTIGGDTYNTGNHTRSGKAVP